MSASGRTVGAVGLLIGVLALVFSGCGEAASGADSMVAPAGAPYSYQLPAGFEVADPSFPGKDPKFLTTIVPDGTAREGTISAFQWTLGAAERGYPAAKLIAWVDHQTHSFYRGEGATLNRGIRTEIGGRQAICWMVHGFDNAFDGRVDADACAILGSHDVVQQACTWKPALREEIERGCAEIRATLKVS